MLQTLDPHSNYFDSEEFNELLTGQQSEYFGIGATIVNYQKDGRYDTFITSVYPGSPAARAGLRFGDKFIAVDGENVGGKSSSYVRNQVRGQKGTIVRLLVERAETQRVEKIDIRRNRVPTPSIPDAYLLRPGVGYIDLSEGFNYTTSDELNACLNELHAQGMKSLILDLRNNPGGILEQAVKVAEKFLPAGSTVVTQSGRYKIDSRSWISRNNQPESVSLVVLVNENSASASEIVAGAMQDHDRAMLVGAKTFGKGLVQSVINLPYNSGLTLTTAKYFTPSGRSIQRDYSDTSLYDYYNHKISASSKSKQTAHTTTGREIFGGDGITPDQLVQNDNLTPPQINLLDPIFFFTRDLVSGRIKGFEDFKVIIPVTYGKRIRSSDFNLSSELIDVFERYASAFQHISAVQLKAERSFIKMRLRYNLATAAYGIIAANQLLIEDDAQVAKAIEALPRAGQLALSARMKRSNK